MLRPREPSRKRLKIIRLIRVAAIVWERQRGSPIANVGLWGYGTRRLGAS